MAGISKRVACAPDANAAIAQMPEIAPNNGCPNIISRLGLKELGLKELGFKESKLRESATANLCSIKQTSASEKKQKCKAKNNKTNA